MQTRHPVTVCLDGDLIKSIDSQRGFVPRSRAFEQLIIRGLSRENRTEVKA
jgi:metal-responsive CopG/Arc/MetJ family transcriptional regulator